MRSKYFGVVKNGKLTLNDQDAFLAALSALSGEVELTIRPKTDKTSYNQMKYIHAIFGIMSLDGELGYTKQEIKSIMKEMFGVRDIVDNQIELKSLARYTTIEMTAFIEDVRRWCAEQTIYIPQPDKLDLD